MHGPSTLGIWGVEHSHCVRPLCSLTQCESSTILDTNHQDQLAGLSWLVSHTYYYLPSNLWSAWEQHFKVFWMFIYCITQQLNCVECKYTSTGYILYNQYIHHNPVEERGIKFMPSLDMFTYASQKLFFRAYFTSFHTQASLLTSLFCSLSYFILAVLKRDCLWNQTCMSFIFHIAIPNGTFFSTVNYRCTMCIRRGKVEILNKHK